VTHDPSRYHFLHGVSPDGKTLAFAEFATYMRFPTGTLGHPADLEVDVRLVRTSNWTEPIARCSLFGGPGRSGSGSSAPGRSATPDMA
jgi:hypothetical protein